AYLGAFTLFGALFITLFLIYKEQLRAFLKKSFGSNKEGKLLLLLFIACLFSLIISFGNEYIWQNTGVKFINVLNPFYWLLEYFPFITQFRVLGRFSWIFYFPAIIVVAFLLEKCLHTWKENKTIKVLGILLI